MLLLYTKALLRTNTKKSRLFSNNKAVERHIHIIINSSSLFNNDPPNKQTSLVQSSVFPRLVLQANKNKKYNCSYNKTPIMKKTFGMGTRSHSGRVPHQGCPFLNRKPEQYKGLPSPEVQEEFVKALEKVNWGEVKSDLKTLLRTSKDFWPADYGHYGGFFIRMAWHATGTYRMR
jgi:hypothetical protein